MKKFWIILFAIVLTFSIAGCGGSTETEKESTPTPQETENTETEQSLGNDLKEVLEEGAQQKITAGDTTVEIGYGWPDYDLLSDIPHPKSGTVAGSQEVEGAMASVSLVDMTLDDCKEYAVKLKEAGFDQNITEAELSGVYTFSADNDDGLHVDCGYLSETVTIQVSVIEE